jgi:HEPN domain-containing protein
MCHQAIEKTLKAYWCGTMLDDSPFTHNHMRLATGCGIYDKMSEDQKDFLDTITNFNIEARYPEDKEALSKRLTKQYCRIIIPNRSLDQHIVILRSFHVYSCHSSISIVILSKVLILT